MGVSFWVVATFSGCKAVAGECVVAWLRGCVVAWGFIVVQRRAVRGVVCLEEKLSEGKCEELYKVGIAIMAGM
jgi:hypothetical protein